MKSGCDLFVGVHIGISQYTVYTLMYICMKVYDTHIDTGMYLYVLSLNTTGMNMDHFALEVPGCVVLCVGSVYLHELRGMQRPNH